MKKITVVTAVLCPSQNALEVLSKCMQSVKNAINKVGGEYVIVDDNSAEGSDFFKSIADIYIKNDETSGVSISLNKGMKQSTNDLQAAHAHGSPVERMLNRK